MGAVLSSSDLGRICMASVMSQRHADMAYVRSLCNEEHLVLEPEEAVLTRKTMCATNVQRRPYGELGSVDKGTACGCCVNVSSGLGPIQPGMGCEEAVVNEIVEELKARMKTRGDTGNIQLVSWLTLAPALCYYRASCRAPAWRLRALEAQGLTFSRS